jgi:hypothetical protein
MKKTVIAHPTQSVNFPETELWLDIAMLADVEISSEDSTHPFKASLSMGGSGWRASVPGPQVIRVVFHKPQSIRHIHLEFSEANLERTQEFRVVAHFPEMPQTEIVRQQWSFSPDGSTSEIEDYRIDLQQVTALELQIDPGRHDKQCLASLDFIALA